VDHGVGLGGRRHGAAHHAHHAYALDRTDERRKDDTGSENGTRLD